MHKGSIIENQIFSSFYINLYKIRNAILIDQYAYRCSLYFFRFTLEMSAGILANQRSHTPTGHCVFIKGRLPLLISNCFVNKMDIFTTVFNDIE